MRTTTYKSILVAALAAMLLPSTASAYDFEYEGIYYNILDSANVEVTHDIEGAYTGFVDIPDAVSYDGNVYQVTAIGEAAFYHCKTLTGVSIPDAVTRIEAVAFNYCVLLGNVDLPSSLNYIGSAAFGRCPAMTRIFIPKFVNRIEAGAFSECPGLETIQVESGNSTYSSGSTNTIIFRPTHLLVAGCKNSVISSNVWYIGDYAFYGCEGLKELNLPSSIKSIGDWSFDRCDSLTSVELPTSVYYIGYGAFSNCRSLQRFSAEEVEYIGMFAFAACHKLTDVNLGHSLTWIDKEAFDWCDALETIDLPESLNKISADAFSACTALTTVICRATTPPAATDAFAESYFGDIYDQVTLYVPRESIDAYAVADEWSKFSPILPIVVGAGPGDVDGDGAIGISDVSNLIDDLLNGNALAGNADVDGDGEVTINDVAVLIDMLLAL